MTLRSALLVLGGTAVLIAAFFPLIGSMVEPVPIRWLNVPFPTTDPVRSGGALSTTVTRCNDTNRTIVTTVARRLVNEETGEALSLLPGASIVDPGCSTMTGGIGLPGDVNPGQYHVEQIVSLPGRWKMFQVPLRTQSFSVVEP